MRKTPELFNEFAAALNKATEDIPPHPLHPASPGTISAHRRALDVEAQSRVWGPLDVARLLTEVSARCFELGDFHKRNGSPMLAAQCYAQSRRCTRAVAILIKGEGEA